MNRNIHIFALAGKKGAGKTFVANSIEQLCSVLNGGYVIQRFKFADALKNLVASFVGGRAKTEMAKNQKIYYDYTGRDLFTLIGQGLRELVHEDIWADSLVNSIDTFIDTSYLLDRTALDTYRVIDKNHPIIIVIDDLRHKNELRKLHTVYGKDNVTTIRIIDPDSKGNKGSHISENDLNDVELDYVYYNPRTENHGLEHLLTIIQKELANKNARLENKD
jgi:dephospho-CoA kinase